MRLKKSIHVLTLTIALSATSCAAPRKAMSEQRSQTHSSQSETTSGETHLQDSAAMRTERLLNEWLAAWLQREETRDEATERVTEIFDTTQPPDSVTGAPRRCQPASGSVTRPGARATAGQRWRPPRATAPPPNARLTHGRTRPRRPTSRPKRPGRARPKAGRRKARTKPSFGCR